MPARHLLLTVLLVVVGLFTYHLLLGPGSGGTPVPPDPDEGSPVASASGARGGAGGPSLASGTLERRLDEIDRRLNGIEARLAARAPAASEGGGDPGVAVREDDIAHLQAVLAEIRRREMEKREQLRYAEMVQRLLPDVDERQRAGAAALLERFYRDARLPYTDPDYPIRPENSAAVREYVEGLRKKLEKDVQGVLPPDMAEKFVRALPGAPVPQGATMPPDGGGAPDGIQR